MNNPLQHSRGIHSDVAAQPNGPIEWTLTPHAILEASLSCFQDWKSWGLVISVSLSCVLKSEYGPSEVALKQGAFFPAPIHVCSYSQQILKNFPWDD